MPSPRGAAYVGDTIALLTGAKGEGYEVLEAHAHAKKLPRGALAGNRFVIRVRDVAGARAPTLATLAPSMPPSRLGLRLLLVTGCRTSLVRSGSGATARTCGKFPPALSAVHPRERTYVLSAARSLVFNAVLAERVNDGSWCRLEAGDVANLDGKGSVFPVDVVDEALTARIAALDVHPTGPMWGKGELLSQGRVRDLEQRIGAELAEACELVIAAGMNQERRCAEARRA